MRCNYLKLSVDVLKRTSAFLPAAIVSFNIVAALRFGGNRATQRRLAELDNLPMLFVNHGTNLGLWKNMLAKNSGINTYPAAQEPSFIPLLFAQIPPEACGRTIIKK